MRRMVCRVVGFLLAAALVTGGCQRDDATTEAGSVAAVADSSRSDERGFNGVFHTATEGSRSMLNLSERAGKVTGMLDAAAIVATAAGERAQGEVRHAGTGATLGTVNLSLADDTIEVELTTIDPQTGQTVVLPAKRYVRGTPPSVEVMLDAQLVGRWRQTWATRAEDGSDGESINVWLILDHAGSIRSGRSSAAEALLARLELGDDGFSGRWRSSEQMIHVKPAGQAQWVPLARYRVESERLHLTYNDGSTHVYERD